MKSKLIKNKYILLIIFLATILRFVNLSSFPAFNADEAAIGYNVYSLIQTGMDEHGNSWPIHFQSFNDYKPGLYFYLVLPFVKLFGLTEIAVRLPNAFLGVMTIVVLYKLVLELFKDKKLALISGLFLAISPWHIHFSRGGWEVNTATFLITAGVWLFVKSRSNIRYLYLSVIMFVFSMYTYHAARIIAPLLGISLLLFYRDIMRKNLSKYLMAGILGFVLLIPLLRDFTSPAGISRVAGVGLFADSGPFSRINEQRGEHDDFGSLVPKLLHNKLTNYGLAFLENWGEHFWGEFLFFSGDTIERNRVPETGQMHTVDFVFVSIGFFFVVRNQKQKREFYLVTFWIVVAPLAAALTFQSPHALRAHNMAIPISIISAYGLLKIINWLDEQGKLRVTGYGLISLLMVWSMVRYLHMYWTHMPKEYRFSSQYGLKELASYVGENEGKYKQIIVSDRYDQPYVFFLFYLKYPPKVFQNAHELTPRDEFGFSTVREFDKYKFTSIDFLQTRINYPDSLIVGTDEEVVDTANIVKEIYGINGYKYFQLVAN